MGKFLQLFSEQIKILQNDHTKENFLKDFKMKPTYQAVFYFKKIKMSALTMSAVMVLLSAW